MKYGRNGGLIVEKRDQCAKCLFFNPDVICALIHALHDRAVELTDPQIKVKNCPQYKPVLEVIKNDEHDPFVAAISAIPARVGDDSEGSSQADQRDIG